MTEKARVTSAMTRRDEAEENPFAILDSIDAQAVIDAQSGKGVGKMIYNIPYRDQNGKPECPISGCPRKGEPHTHVVGVGASGINNLTRLMGGISVRLDSMPYKARDEGTDYYCAVATALDIFTGTEQDGFGRVKITNQNKQFAPNIAAAFAKRNAAKALIDPSALQRLEEMGKKGIDTFSESDAETIFGPMIRERLAYREAYFKARAALLSNPQPLQWTPQSKQLTTAKTNPVDAAKPINTAPPSDEEPPPNVDAAPPQEDAPQGKSGPKTDWPGSDPQKRAVWAILKRECQAEDDAARQFIAECLTTKQTISQFIGDANKKDLTMWNDWDWNKE
jgi:hypothetical protein